MKRALAALAVADAVDQAKADLDKAQAAIKEAKASDDKEALVKAQVLQSSAAKALELSDVQKDEQDWLERLSDYLKKKDAEAKKEERAEINGRTWSFRLGAVEPNIKVHKILHVHLALLHLDLNLPFEESRKTYVASATGVPMIVSASAKPKWFKWSHLNNLVFSVGFCAIVGLFIQIAKRKPNLFIRKIAGLEAVDEAIGRSTEMDRPVFFVHGGSSDMSDVATMASINILSRVARRTAEHDSRICVMNNEPIVTAVSQEVVQQAYSQAGRADAYNPDDVALVASEQFSYVAAVSGRMVREQPGAIFLLGSFFAESLLLAETGASTGAIQVAGTDQYTQLPFFITTCDYTLIGEELYAASAYLSREPRLLGSLRGQDVGKAFFMIVIVAGTIALTVADVLAFHWDWLRDIFKAGPG
jgi:hypothetical protein